MPELSAEWRGRSEFAEVAEVLGINTDQVMALLPNQIVLYTVGRSGTVVWSANLARDDDGVLHATNRRERPDFWDDLKAKAERDLRRKGGTP